MKCLSYDKLFTVELAMSEKEICTLVAATEYLRAEPIAEAMGTELNFTRVFVETLISLAAAVEGVNHD